MDISKVRELVKMVEESGIEELELIQGETTIRIQKSAPYAAVPAPAPVHIQAPVGDPVPAPAPAAPVAPAEAQAAPAVDASRARYKDVRSPIVGTFYRAPSPDSPPFANVGDRIQAGQTLCIVEAMKVMNEIEAEFGGTIKEILVEDATPIEAEAVLFLVEPD
ncbi:acetyl-CoA carboxylase, biotin carboxyl carrier protein [bacterium DOLJORAL78_65_58]|nr:MAG: acetyl-CoA carboxylase, biotin carboxyl carrier protein [bacterium DOLZORAL124_64_63]PIE76653.1 MAG: acetyl-CoA carboxylase, biotin carboxyl carrier protein [bacterium DOLJORAL78_65_58]